MENLKAKKPIKQLSINQYKNLQQRISDTIEKAEKMHQPKEDNGKDMLDDVFNEYNTFQQNFKEQLENFARIYFQIIYRDLQRQKSDIEIQLQQEGTENQALARKNTNIQKAITSFQREAEEASIDLDFFTEEDTEQLGDDIETLLLDLNSSLAVFELWEEQIGNQAKMFNLFHDVLNALRAKGRECGMDVTYDSENNTYLVDERKLEEMLGNNIHIDADTIKRVLGSYQSYKEGFRFNKDDPATITDNDLYTLPLSRIKMIHLKLQIEGLIKNKEEYFRNKMSDNITGNNILRGANISIRILLHTIGRNLLLVPVTISNIVSLRTPRKKRALLSAPKTKKQKMQDMVNLILSEIVEKKIENYLRGTYVHQNNILLQLFDKYENDTVKIRQILEPWITQWYKKNGVNLYRDGENETDTEFANRLITYYILNELDAIKNEEELNVAKDNKSERKKFVTPLSLPPLDLFGGGREIDPDPDSSRYNGGSGWRTPGDD